MTEIISERDKSRLFKQIFDIVSNSINQLLQHQENVILAISGGNSVQPLFDLFRDERLPWEKMYLFMTDERLVPINDQASNYNQAKIGFIDNMIARNRSLEERIHPFFPNFSKADFGIADYEDDLKKVGGVFDIIILGAGEDGHIAALFPNHHSIRNESDFFFKMNDCPKPPGDRMTSSKKLLQTAKVALVLLIDDGKAETLGKINNNSVDYEECPAKLVISIGSSYFLTNLDRN